MSRPASHALLQRLLLAASTGLAACGGGDVNDTGSRTGGEGGNGTGGAAGTGTSGSSGQSAAGSPLAGQGGSPAAGASGAGGPGGAGGAGAGGTSAGAAGGVVVGPPGCVDPALIPLKPDGSIECTSVPGGVCTTGCYVPGQDLGGQLTFPTTCVPASELTEEQIGYLEEKKECGMKHIDSGPYCGTAYSFATKQQEPGCCYAGASHVCVGRPLRIGSEGRTAALRSMAW